MNEALFVICEVGIGMIAVPWCAWVTAQIFGLQKQIALQSQAVEIFERIEKLLSEKK